MQKSPPQESVATKPAAKPSSGSAMVMLEQKLLPLITVGLRYLHFMHRLGHHLRTAMETRGILL